MENVSTNQNYRKSLIKGAFEIMKSNQREYSKQSHFYLPKSNIITNKMAEIKKVK